MSAGQPRAGTATPGSESGIRFSIISAAHDVEPYLAEFIRSVEAQRFPLERVQVVVVDDGSTDGTAAVLRGWQERRPELVTVLTQPNRGAPAARNSGLEQAVGEWVTFADPDDLLEADYLANVDAFLTATPQTRMIACNRSIYDEHNGALLRHPLARAVPSRDRLLDLRSVPGAFYDSASSAFFDRAVLESEGLRFDPRVRPTFDGAHFCARYLLGGEEPVIGYVQSAGYLHRLRADGRRSQNITLRDPERFTTVPRVGILGLLREATPDGGAAPEWLQNLVLCELARYFRPEQVSGGATTAVRGDLADSFLQSLTEIVALLDPQVIESYRSTRFDRTWREILLHGLDGSRWSTPYVVVQQHDPIHEQVQLAYRFVGAPPEEEVLFNGRPIRIVDAKVRVYEFFGRPMLYERLAWIPAHRYVRVLLDGAPRPVVPEWPETPMTTVRASQFVRWREGVVGYPTEREPLTNAERFVQRLARTLPVRRRFARAWVLMDKAHEANDNAERLFGYLRAERPKVNAWFVLESGSPDWKRLAEVDRRRLVAYGSTRWKLLMLNCAHVVSSQADQSVLRPPSITRLREPDWKFSFIQHGVIKSDLSRWLNNQSPDLMVTSTPMELQSIAGDYTPYRLTTKEAKLTGLPRFDRLRELGSRVPPAERDVILVCPTWRYWLTMPKEVGSHRRVVTADFLDSEYARMWLGLLASPELKELAQREGARVVFLPHPNVESALDSLPIPAHVEAVGYAGNDVQQLIARSVLMITDYSSVSFDAAYLDRPVVYFQFDAEHALDSHNGRPGYYDHERDGFGPVTESIEAAVAAVAKVFADGRTPQTLYAQRIAQTFPDRDGRCCERTADAITELTRRPKRFRVDFRG